MPIEELDKWKETMELIEGGSEPGSPTFQREKLKIQVIAAMDLELALHDLRKSMDDNARSSDGLARKVFWLNVILTAATSLAALVAIVELARTVVA